MHSVGDPLARVIARLENVKKSGDGHAARCPAHHDRRNSLAVRRGDDGRVLVHCHAGCEPEDVVSAIGLAMADLFPSPADATTGRTGPIRGTRGGGGPIPPDNAATAQHAGLTLARYAEAKQLDPNRLRALGVSDAPYFTPPAIRIAYRDEAGNEAAVRFRLLLDKSTDGDDRFKWRRGSKLVPLRPGSARLRRGSAATSCWWKASRTATRSGATANRRSASLVRTIGTRRGTRRRFDGIPVDLRRGRARQGRRGAARSGSRTSRIRDRAQLVGLGPHKDPSALHCDDPEQFAERWAGGEGGGGAAVGAVRRRGASGSGCRLGGLPGPRARAGHPRPRGGDVVAALGVAGERVAVMLVFLAMVSRLLPRPVSVAVKGPSSAGKSFLVEQTLRLVSRRGVLRAHRDERAGAGLLRRTAPASHARLVRGGRLVRRHGQLSHALAALRGAHPLRDRGEDQGRHASRG